MELFENDKNNELIKNDNKEQLEERQRAQTTFGLGNKKRSINNEKYYQIIKLLNDNIIYLNENKIMRLQPAFNNNYNRHCIEVGENLICMVEINENKFCVYSENNNITIFNSNIFEDIKTFSIGNTENIRCTKIQMIDSGTMAGMGKNKIYIISLNKYEIVQTFDTEKTITDMIITKSNKIIISGYDRRNNCLTQYKYNVLKDVVSLSKNDRIESGSRTRINKLFLLDNKDNNKENNYGRLLCFHNDGNLIEIYEGNKNKKNNNNIKK